MPDTSGFQVQGADQPDATLGSAPSTSNAASTPPNGPSAQPARGDDPSQALRGDTAFPAVPARVKFNKLCKQYSSDIAQLDTIFTQLQQELLVLKDSAGDKLQHVLSALTALNSCSLQLQMAASALVEATQLVEHKREVMTEEEAQKLNLRVKSRNWTDAWAEGPAKIEETNESTIKPDMDQFGDGTDDKVHRFVIRELKGFPRPTEYRRFQVYEAGSDPKNSHYVTYVAGKNEWKCASLPESSPKYNTYVQGVKMWLESGAPLRPTAYVDRLVSPDGYEPRGGRTDTSAIVGLRDSVNELRTAPHTTTFGKRARGFRLNLSRLPHKLAKGKYKLHVQGMEDPIGHFHSKMLADSIAKLLSNKSKKKHHVIERG